MKHLIRSGMLIAVALMTGPMMAAELETDAQKLGYIIGMDIGKSLKEQGTPVDLDSLITAIRATYNGEKLAMTPEEAGQVRKEYIEKRQAELILQRLELKTDRRMAEPDGLAGRCHAPPIGECGKGVELAKVHSVRIPHTR